MKIFVLMVQFLTRIPINIELSVKKEDFARGVVYFPIVGLVIGAINGLVYFITSQFLTGWVPLLMVITSNVLITGGLHLDGLADSCDGLFSARKKDRMLEIMKDSRIGTNGAIALILSILLRVALLDIIPKSIIIPSIVTMTIVGRGAMALILYGAKYAREEGLGELFIGKTPFLRTAISSLILVLLVYMSLRKLGIVALIISLAISYGLRSYFNKIIGGLTGDLLGAINEVVELGFLFSVVAFWGYL